MDWSSVGKIVGTVAPLLGSVLTGPVGMAVTAAGMLAKALGTEATPDAIHQAIAADPEWAAKVRIAEDNNRTQLESLTIQMESNNLSDVNQTFREELKSEDRFVRWARPSMIWAISLSVVLEVIVAGLVVFIEPGQIANMATLFGAVAIPQGIAAAVCGVYMKKRSDDKMITAGMQPGIGGLLPTLIAKFQSK
jgi:hypothetical protein